MAIVSARPRPTLARARFAPAAGWKAWARRHVWLLPVVLLAAWLRFAGIASRFLYGDEAEYAIVARYLSRDWLFLSYPAIEGMGVQPFVSQPPLVPYLMALSMRVFGPTDLAARLPSILFGVATVIAVYAVGHRLGGRFMGLSAAAILAVMPFHVELSRKAQLDAGFTFFFVLTAYFLVAWLQERRMRQAVGVGVAAACAALSKLPGVLAGPVVLVVFLVALATVLVQRARGAAAPRDVATTLAHGGVGAGVVALGALLYVGLLSYLEAMRNLWIKLQWQLGRVDPDTARVQEAAAVSRDWTWYFTDPQHSFQEQFGGLVLGLAIVGLVVSLILVAKRPVREQHHLVVPLFVVVVLSFFLYSERKEGFYLLPFAPFAALLVAYSAEGLRRMLAWAGIRVSALAPRAAPLAIAVALVLVAMPAYAGVTESYDKYVLGDDQEKFFGSGTKEAALWIQERDPEAGQYGTLLGRFTLLWYNEQPTYHWYVDHTTIDQDIRSGKLKYVVYDDYLQLPFDREFMKQLIDTYGGTPVATYKQGWGAVTVYELHA